MDPLVGSMLGKDYRVLEPIGFGGMAVVYLVEHQTLRKRFAAKVLSVELAANREARARFNQEAHAASQLDHENIVNISDFGSTADQRPFFVMELLRGQTLDQRIAEAPMSLEEVVAVAVPVARALAHAHAEGIVHRDIKPENVFLVQRTQGRFGIKVVDFGVAKMPINTRLTKMGETLGSPMFMSPEACRGDDVDHRADVYSFGVVLYLMLCGRVPFDDANLLKVLQMQISAPLPPPRSINPEISPELAAVIERALAKDPAARYESMDALLLDLEQAVPPGADRLLIEAQTGRASSFIGHPSGRIGDSQQISRVSSQPLPSYVSKQIPVLPSSGVRSAMPTYHGRRRTWWLLAVLLIGGGAVAGWRAMAHDVVQAAPVAEARVVSAPHEAARESPAVAAAPQREAHLDPARAGTVHLHLTTTPHGAAVELDGKRLGATPLDADVARLDGEARLVVSRDGFAAVTQRLDLRTDQSLSLVLSPVARPKPTRRRPPPAGSHREPGRVGNTAGSDTATVAPEADPDLDIRSSR